MNCIYSENIVTIKNISDFCPEHTFMCGQCFRWDEQPDQSYTGVAFGKVINVACSGDTLTLKNITPSEYESQWKHYLDLDTDYSHIKNTFVQDKNLKKAMDFGWGIKILNQDVFECLISFIISTQNTIVRIRKIVQTLCRMYGQPITYEGKTYYSFPTVDSLKNVTEEDLAPLKSGYRASYIVDAVQKIAQGKVCLDALKDMQYSQAKSELMKIKGVGPKVADCVLLFSCGKKEAFPVDVWVKRTMRTLYLGENANEKQISLFASGHFGEYAGVAQQYLFYYARENNITDNW